MRYQTFFRKSIGVGVIWLSCLWHLYSQSCDPLPAFNQQFNNQTLNVAQTFTAQNIRITGTVNFNANITMVRCTVLMDPGAVLNVNNSTFSLLDNATGRSVIYGCTEMWSAINVNTNGAVVLRNSDIGDGIFGLVFNSGFLNGVTQISGCSFSRNTNSILAVNVSNLTFATFSGNTFTGSPWIDPLLPPHVAGNPQRAMFLFNSSGMIGTSGTENLVRWMTTGALVFGSNITFNNIHFRTSYQSANGTDPGAGIHSVASSLTIQNIFSNNASCRFTNNRLGIRSERTSSLTVKNAVFQSQGVSDIEVVNSTNPYNVNISSNTMNLSAPSGQSILLNRAAQAAGINTRIQSNTINLPWGAGTLPNSIRIINITTQAGATDQAVIADNQITCAYGNPAGGGNTTTIDGIYIAGNADGYQVSGNIINYVNPNGPPNAAVNSVAIGVVNNNGVNNIVGPNNTITTTRFNGQPNQRESWLRCGVHIDGSQNVAVCKNDADDPRHCYHFNGNCANAEWGRNIIRDGYFGLALTSITFPNQNYRMNQWTPGSTYNTNSAHSLAGAAGLPWLADGTLPGHIAPQPTNPFAFQFNIPNGGTSGTPICDAVVPPPGGFGEPPTGVMAEKFLNDEYGLTNAAAAWDFERTLLYQMIRFPATYTGNSTATTYYNGKVNSSIWQFGKAERMLHEATAVSTQDQQSLDQLHSSNRALIDSLGTIEQWEGADTTSTNPDWQDAKTNLLAQISANQGQITVLDSSIRSQHLSNLENVMTYVNSLPTSSTLESNYKTLLNLMVKQHLGESWTLQDSVSLRAIANLCPETDGEAVTIARGMLPVPESYSFGREDNDPACDQERGETAAPLKENTGIALWPNPAADMLTVDFRQPFSGTLEIVNSSGTVVHSITLNGAVREHVPTGRLANGLYFLRVLVTGQPLQTLKFTVAH